MLGTHILGITNTKNQLAWFEKTSVKKNNMNMFQNVDSNESYVYLDGH
jgi:hypothetical protein